MTPRERADGARELLRNESFKAVFRELRDELMVSLENVGITDYEVEHEGVRTLQVLKRIETKLQRYVEDGKLEEHKQKEQGFIEKTRQSVSEVWRKR